MAFNDEKIKASGAKLYYIVEMMLDSGSRFFSLPAHKSANAFYSGRVLGLSGMIRQGDIIGSDVQTSEARLFLEDNDEEISTLLENEAIMGKTATVSIGFKGDDGTMFTSDVYSGTMERRQSSVSEQQIAIIPKLREAIGIFQRSITEAAFPLAPGSTLGQGLNIVMGDVDSDDRDNGAVYCPIVDTNNRYVAVAGHACKLADNFIKVKGDVITNITPSAISYTATDAKSQTYTRATIGVGDWDVDALYYCDCQGLETAGDGTGSVIYNPGTLIEKLITDFSDLTASDIDTTAFNTFEALMTTREYDTPGEWGGCIPWSPGELIEDPLEVLSELAFNVGGMLYVTGDGKIAIADSDLSEVESSTSGLTLIQEKDLTQANATLSRAPFTILNKTRVPYRWAHKINSSEKALIAEDEGSISLYGETKENETLLYFVRGTDTVEDLMNRYLLKRGGNPRSVVLPLNGFHKHSDFEIGDTILLTHDHVGGGLTEKQIRVASIDTPFPRFGQRASASGHTFETVTGTTRGDVIGPVSFSGEETIEIVADIDTYVDSGAQGTSHANDATIKHGGYIEIDEGEIGEQMVEQLGRRSTFRFDTSAISGSTISEVSMRIRVTSVQSGGGGIEIFPKVGSIGGVTTDSGTPSLAIHRLNSTGWAESDTWNNWASGTFSDSLITTQYSSAQSISTIGYYSYVINSSGLSYMQTQVTAGNPIEISLTPIIQGYGFFLAADAEVDTIISDTSQPISVDIASSENATAAYRPRLIITYV